ncbi:MAG: TetR/AcrR family transcriptional regulator [Chitinophagaceae bacterium]|nr:MAG: TetR/AcrR family transcriptional regulator [Chitinophagaceae bacterium]
MSFYNTILQEAIEIFHTNGVDALSEKALIRKLNVSEATFHEFFENKEDLLLQAISYSLEEEREEHTDIRNASLNPVEEIMGMLNYGIKQLKEISPLFFPELIKSYPAAWDLYMEQSHNYTVPQLADILERGIEEGYFCNDINVDIVTRLILGQVNVMLDQTLFPADQFRMSEIYKAVYLHLIRGICTREGVEITEKFFSFTKSEKSAELPFSAEEEENKN